MTGRVGGYQERKADRKQESWRRERDAGIRRVGKTEKQGGKK